MRVDFLGIPVDVFTAEEALSAVHTSNEGYALTLNPELVWHAFHKPEVLAALQWAKFVFCDGTGIHLGLRILKGVRAPRITGIDLLTGLLQKGGRQFYFLGTTEKNLQKAVNHCQDLFPQSRVVGYHSGFFSPGEEEGILEDIRRSGADFLVVGMGMPRQELWLYRHRARLSGFFSLTVGGALDVLSGAVPRAPIWLRSSGLEWSYRLLLQPSRISRLLTAHPYFVWQVFREKFRR